MNHYEQAIQDIPDREQETRKWPTIKAGKLAMGLKDLAKADKYLTTLASMDYTYRDTSELLERLHRMKDEEGKKGGGQEKARGREEGRRTKQESDEEERDERRAARRELRIFRQHGFRPLWTNSAGFRQNG